MQEVINRIKRAGRAVLGRAGRWLNSVSNGKISPNAVAVFGMLMHVPIAIAIARGRFAWAAVLLIIFGLFGVLGGELARVQQKAGARGMLLDASTDRMKEVILYSGAGYYLASGAQPAVAVWAVIACGASLIESYVTAKGEAMTSGQGATTHPAPNFMVAYGLLTFEVRIFLLVLGLLTGQLLLAVAGIAILASLTALQRLITVSEKLT